MDSKQYSDINVAVVDVENFADFKIRTFILSCVRTFILQVFVIETKAEFLMSQRENCRTTSYKLVSVWLSGNTLVSINVVTLRLAQYVPE